MRHSIKRIVLIEAWAEGYITLLYKTNDILDPSNYRGLIIKSSIGKLFNRVLNAWLDKFLIKYNVIDECQIGFRKKARTSDHMFVLKTIIDEYCVAGKVIFLFCWFPEGIRYCNSHWYQTETFRYWCWISFFYNIIKNMYSVSK